VTPERASVPPAAALRLVGLPPHHGGAPSSAIRNGERQPPTAAAEDTGERTAGERQAEAEQRSGRMPCCRASPIRTTAWSPRAPTVDEHPQQGVDATTPMPSSEGREHRERRNRTHSTVDAEVIGKTPRQRPREPGPYDADTSSVGRPAPPSHPESPLRDAPEDTPVPGSAAAFACVEDGSANASAPSADITFVRGACSSVLCSSTSAIVTCPRLSLHRGNP
jgi:hypothetical protein